MAKNCKITQKQYNSLKENYFNEKKYKRLKYLSIIDPTKVLYEELQKQYIDLRFCIGITDGFGSSIGKIAEGASYSDANETADADKTIEDLKLKFDFNNQWQVQKVIANNQVSIIVAVGFIGENKELLIDSLNNAGYFKSFEMETNIRGMKWLKMQFEPMFEENKVDEIRKYGTAWHWTPSYNEKDILEKGFIPKTENSPFSFPSRIYFLNGNMNIQEILNIGKKLYSSNRDARNNGIYTLFLINTLDLPNDCKFYYDPNLRNAMFTETPLSNMLIINHRRFNLKNSI